MSNLEVLNDRINVTFDGDEFTILYSEFAASSEQTSLIADTIGISVSSAFFDRILGVLDTATEESE